ncbi:zinc finger protein 583-like [Trichogramma pretiosum]|uniref:zinc finger protein 583-like n=1 Tax=Trichogramma pretiosum TaxID=7493 RepID=UPI0006C98535|nr:zinc finger protein 583-like [Trichogramma pretiosum]
MMEHKEDTVRVKKETNNTWSDAGHNNVFDSWNSCEEKKFETFTFCESSANQMNEAMEFQAPLDERRLVELECKDVKPELPALQTIICKSEHQSFIPIVKIENENQCNDTNEKIFIDFECRDVKPELKYFSTTIGKIENCEQYKDLEIFKKISKTKLSNECKTCRKTYKQKVSLKRHVNAKHNSIRPHQCEVCQKSFGQKSHLKTHVNAIHIGIKPFECEICLKSFSDQSNLNKHLGTIHDRRKPYECVICHKSFGQKSHINKHITTVHDRSKPFECEICRKSFGQRSNLIAHINLVHNRSKPFECEICQKSFGYQSVLKAHINSNDSTRSYQTI